MKMIIKKRNPEEIKIFYMKNLHKVKFQEKTKSKEKIQVKVETYVKK
jgi:hypothetical protein